MNRFVRMTVHVIALALLAGCAAGGGNGGAARPSRTQLPEPLQQRALGTPRPAQPASSAATLAPERTAAQTPSPVGPAAASPAGEGAAVSQQPQARKTAYLTFDDGPSVHTDQILDILRREQVRATFFVNGNTTAEGARLYRRIAAEGHVLGNHTFSHSYARVYASVEAYRADTERLNELLARTAGVRPDIIRFPGGSNNRLAAKSGGPTVMRRIITDMTASGYSYFDWNVSSTDAAQAVQPKADIVDAVLGASRGKTNAIVLMHDVAVKTTTVEALSDIIAGLKAQGFAFATLSKSSYTFRFRQ